MDGLIVLAILIFVGYRVYQSVQQNMEKNEKLNRRRPDAISRTKHGANASFEKRQARQEALRKSAAEKKTHNAKPQSRQDALRQAVAEKTKDIKVKPSKPAVSKPNHEPVSEEFRFHGAWDEELVDLVARNKKMEAVELMQEHTGADFDKALGAVNLVKGGLSPDEAVAWIQGREQDFEDDTVVAEVSTEVEVSTKVEAVVEEIIEAVVES